MLKQSWFEKHQGLITFFGYLAATLIGGVSLIYSIHISNSTLQLGRHQDSLNQKQFNYLIHKDSIADELAMKQIRRQDSLNKHQDSINIIQLENYKSQTLIAKEQLENFKKQTSIAKTQLANTQNVHQEQLIENKPSFSIQDFVIDSITNKPKLFLKSNIANIGKRSGYIQKINAIMWFSTNNNIEVVRIPVKGEALPNSHTFMYLPYDSALGMDENTVILIQVAYEDKIVSGTQVYRLFITFRTLKPLLVIQADDNLKQKFMDRILKDDTKNALF